MPARPRSSPFVGRGQELARLVSGLETAQSGDTTTVFVHGESGVGKSRLLEELAQVASEREVVVLTGATVHDDETAFWPFRAALLRLLDDPTHPWALEALQPFGGDLTVLLPSVPGLARRRFDVEDRVRPLDVLFQAFVALAKHRPIAVMLDDMHRADRGSRSLLAHLLAAVTDQPAMFVVAYRSEGRPPRSAIHGLALELHRGRRAELLWLEPLDPSAVAQLLPPDQRHLAEVVWQRSSGNAFFAEELVAALRITPHEPTRLPETLREVIGSRLQASSDAARLVVRAIAVGQQPVTHRLLQAVLGWPEQDLLAAVREAVEAGFAVPDPSRRGYSLRHGLLRETVTADLLPGELLDLHRRFAESLACSPVLDARSAGALARHWWAAEEWTSALDASAAAGESAESVFEYADAEEHWTRHLALLDRLDPDSPSRLEVLQRVARAAHLAGDVDQALEALGACLDSSAVGLSQAGGRPDFEARILGELGRCLVAAGRPADAVDAHARAVALLADSTEAELRAELLAGYAEALEQVGRYRASHAQASRALIEGSQDPALRARILPTLGFALAYLGAPEPAVMAVTDGIQAAEEARQPELVASAHLRLCELLCGPLNRLEDGIDAGQRAARAIDGLGLGRTYGVRLQTAVANALFRLGDWRTASEVIEAALASGPTGTAAIALRLAWCRLLIGRGDLDLAEKELDVIEALGGEAVGARHHVPLLTLRAGVALWRGRPDLARDFTRQGLGLASSGSEDTWLVAALLWHGQRAEAELADAARLYGRPVETSEALRLGTLMEELLAASQQTPGVRASILGYQQLCAGEAARVAGAADPAVWDQAATTWLANRHPYPAAYARLRQAESLFATGARAAGAVPALAEAWALSRSLGAVLLDRQIAALARRAGVRLTPPGSPNTSTTTGTAGGTTATTTGTDAAPVSQQRGDSAPEPPTWTVVDTLTPREKEVLAEIAEGRSNQQIAHRMFISEKTVSVHVSHILSKLGVRSRVQAALLSRGVEAWDDRQEPS
jgi:DNA-binding CsgD family transcriptional regulator/tetratricopeptide (TPR) repeat protein